ncbi:hypothetical protein H7Y63_01340 [Polaromonas sp.]|nr:hypothetical protein [Candidatus Saccharibacteria bacterium]
MHPQQNYSAPQKPNDYDFIVNPSAPARRPLLAGKSTLGRVVIVLAGLFILFILFVIVRGLLSGGGGNKPALIKVASQQQEIITITKAAENGRQPISSTNRNIVVTTGVSITSAQSELLSYMKDQRIKVTKKQLIYPNASAVNAQLAAAVAASTYDPTLHDVLKAQLTDYQLALKQAYGKTSGTKGRELLNKQYDQATLLLKQLDTI